MSDVQVKIIDTAATIVKARIEMPFLSPDSSFAVFSPSLSVLLFHKNWLLCNVTSNTSSRHYRVLGG